MDTNFKKERGFAPLIILLIVAAMAGIAYTSYRVVGNLQTSSSPTPSEESQNVSGSGNLFDISTPTPKSTLKASPTVKPKTLTPTPKATQSSGPATSSCGYDLSSATGAIQLVIQPQTGNITSSTTGDVYATSGCKVLDGKSTDHINTYGKPGANTTIIFNSVPPGTYSVKTSWKGISSSTQTVTVTSGKSSYAYFSVAGDAPPTQTPTATPQAKPACNVTFMNLGGSQKVCVGNTSNPAQQLTSEYVDFEGDGTWEYSGALYGCHQYTYSTGTHTAKAKVLGTNGLESDVCQGSITIN